MKTKLEKIDWGGRNSNKGKNENDGKLLRMKMEEAYKEGKCVNEDGGWKMGTDNDVDYDRKEGLKVIDICKMKMEENEDTKDWRRIKQWNEC